MLAESRLSWCCQHQRRPFRDWVAHQGQKVQPTSDGRCGVSTDDGVKLDPRSISGPLLAGHSMFFAIPLVVVLGGAGVQAARLSGGVGVTSGAEGELAGGGRREAAAASRPPLSGSPHVPGTSPSIAEVLPPLSPAEKRQLHFDGRVAVICTLMMAAHHLSVFHRLGGLDNLQVVLIPLPGEVGPATAPAGKPAAHGWCVPAPV